MSKPTSMRLAFGRLVSYIARGKGDFHHGVDPSVHAMRLGHAQAPTRYRLESVGSNLEEARAVTDLDAYRGGVAGAVHSGAGV